ncbi:MAG: VacJ family lipoprotein [Alphaproteobacteria bacterium]|nr:VacJ family lipoprotein [Alphaproteobacteria bacterium]MBO6627333.1 VacJ family lipoprotein [Alphaproteobacteria bacterium]MDF1626907.1 VacJ family lipoprotein [Parvibaculaceae bacterium]
MKSEIALGNRDVWGNRSIWTVLLGLTVLTAGCATRPDATDTAAVAAYEEANDPIEPLNRYFFELNNFFDTILLRPSAEIYDGVLPSLAKDGVRNFLDNLRSPVILANDILQGEWERAETTTSRFGINTTAGVLGLGDPATGWGYTRHGEDFGQTLAVYGVGEGPYFYAPLLGPAPPRDLVGFGVDMLFDPLTYIFWDDGYTVPVTRFLVNGIDIRARNLETLDEIERTSVDYYAAIRSLYRQSRKDEIANGVTDLDDLPDISNINLSSDE